MTGLSTKLGAVLLALTTATCSVRLIAVGDSSHTLGTRASYDESSRFKGGFLFIDGKQTSCELGIIDNKASFISANCLKYKSDGKVDTAPKYEVYIDNLYDNTPSHHTMETVTVHPDYDPKTFANNIAILQYNSQTNPLWYSYTSVDSSDWSDIVYGRHIIKDTDAQVWNPASLVSNPYVDPSCDEASPVYKSNKKDLLCSDASAKSAVSSSCQTPYGMVYGAYNNTLYQVGIYSHSAIYGGSDFCKYDHQRSYYTVLANYLAFANSILNRTVYYSARHTSPQSNPKYKMKTPTDAPPKDAKIVGGDFYAQQRNLPKPSSSASSSPSQPTSGQDPPPSSQSSSSGLSKKTTIIIGVCVPVGTVILVAGLYFFVKWLRRAGRNLAWNPDAEDAHMTMVTSGISDANHR